MVDKTVFFWFDSPPKVGKGAFNYVANNWGEQVYFVFNNDFRAERKASNWNDGDFGKASIIELFKSDNPQQKILDIFSKHPNAVHIVNGFTTQIMQKVKNFVANPDANLIVLSERPDLMGNPIEKIVRSLYFNVKYRLIFNQFKNSVKAFLPLGKMGVNTFRKYGWNNDIMFPFMYNPQLRDISNECDRKVHTPLHFLYVGRFYHKTKGTDVLMKATNYLKGEWNLDLVGGYGPDADDVTEWAKEKSRVNYIGRWNSLEVTRNMQNYDVVIVPTKYDGWNLLVNEGLHAGIAVITTDEAVSHEVVEKSGAGLVVKANRPKELAKAMQAAIDNPELVSEWKAKTSQFVTKISSPVVGQYLIDIINYSIFKEGKRPVCPWL